MSDDQADDGSRRFGPLPEASMDPAQRTVAGAIRTGPRGSSTGMSGPFEALLRSPDLADAVQRLGVEVRFRSSLPVVLNELAIIMTARRWSAQFEWDAHRRMALDAGLDPEVADAVAVGRRPELDGDGTAVYEFATQLLEGGDVTDDAWRAVVERWGKRGAVDLIGTVGYYCLVSFVLNVDRYPVPGGELPLGPR